MKPKTATEFKVVEISNALKAISHQQHKTAFAKCFDSYAVQSRKTMFCLECGSSWKLTETNEIKKVACEKCDKKLTAVGNYNNGLKETDYYQVVTAVENFQIVRMVCITKTMKKNLQASFFAQEVMQIFIDENGKPRCLSKNVMGLSQYFDQWIIGSELSLKYINNNRFALKPSFIITDKNVLPVIKRNGFKGDFHGIAPQILFTKILTDSIAETLLKSNQGDLLHYHIRNTSIKPTGIYWNAIRICNRNNYCVKDSKLWVDYLDLLSYFGKDLRNPKYVCPENLEYAHNKLMAKKQKEIWRNTLQVKKRQIAKNQKQYFRSKGQFFGLVFSEKNISISVIETVREFLEEGCIHNHCVFTNDYYKKENSLILCAKVNGIPAETIQVSLETLEILQSRGYGNKATKHNKAIINLVNRNLHKIGDRMKNAS